MIEPHSDADKVETNRQWPSCKNPSVQRTVPRQVAVKRPTQQTDLGDLEVSTTELLAL